jgi:hypothetical protein
MMIAPAMGEEKDGVSPCSHLTATAIGAPTTAYTSSPRHDEEALGSHRRCGPQGRATRLRGNYDETRGDWAEEGWGGKRGNWGGVRAMEVEQKRGLGKRFAAPDWRLGFSLWSVFLYQAIKQ